RKAPSRWTVSSLRVERSPPAPGGVGAGRSAARFLVRGAALRDRPVGGRNGDAGNALAGEAAAGIARFLLALEAAEARAIERAVVRGLDRDRDRHGLVQFRRRLDGRTDAVDGIRLLGEGADLDDPASLGDERIARRPAMAGRRWHGRGHGLPEIERLRRLRTLAGLGGRHNEIAKLAARLANGTFGLLERGERIGGGVVDGRGGGAAGSGFRAGA